MNILAISFYTFLILTLSGCQKDIIKFDFPTTEFGNAVNDTQRPSISIATAPSYVFGSANIPIIVTFSEPVVGFTASDISRNIRTINNFTGSGSIYSFTIVSSGTATVTVSIPENRATDPAGNSNTASTLLSITRALVVEPIYQINGACWNSYIVNNGSTPYTATGASCLGSESRFTDCLHAGELLQVTIPAASSCSGLSLTDSLGVFNWICNVSGGVTRFYTAGFRDNKSLKDLVDAAGWRPNQVTLVGGASLQSLPGSWWPNPVMTLPSNGLMGSSSIQIDGIDDDGAGPDQIYQEGTIFVVASDQSSFGYNLNLNKLALVILDGAKLTNTIAPVNNCNSTNGEGAADSSCLILVSGQSFIWLEGNISGDDIVAPHQKGVFLHNTTFSQLRYLGASKFGEVGIGLISAAKNFLYNVGTSNNALYGIQINNSQYNILERSISSNNTSHGINLTTDANSNFLINIISANNGGRGVNLAGAEENILQGALLNNNQQSGLALASSSINNVISLVTSASNNNGLHVDSPRNTFSSILVVNSTLNGIEGTTNSDFSTYSQIATSNNTTYGFQILDPVTHIRIFGNLLVGSNGISNCRTDSTHPHRGLVNGTCTSTGTDGSTGFVGTQLNAVLRINRDLTQAFSGKVNTDDLQNLSDTSGSAADPSIDDFDWLNFDSFLRSWGKDGGVFPAADQQNRWVSGNGRIWDFSLDPADSVVYNTTGDGTSPNADFVDGSPCPAILNGSVTALDQRNTSSAFLRNAFEVLMDRVGDDDGLCESNEVCIYSPHYGAYQGTGGIQSTCIFSNGTVTGVSMHAYDSEVAP